MTELKKALQSKRVDDLRFVCEFFAIENSKSLRKNEIVELLNDKLSGKNTLDFIYPYLLDDEIDMLRRAETGFVPETLYDESKLWFLSNLGYVCIKDEIVLVSDIIVDYLNESHPELEAKRKQFRVINDYFTACANLYGVVPLDIVVDQYNKYEHKRLKKQQIDEIAKIADIKGGKYTIAAGTLINEEVFFLGDDYLEDLVEAQSDKPFIVLPKEELLRYIDGDYTEKTPQYRRMVTMLSLILGVGRREANEITDQLSHMAKAQMSFDSIFGMLEEMDVVFADENEVDKFVAAYAELSNNTRMWENCGCTPVEIRRRMMK